MEVGQRKGRLFQVIGLAGLRSSRELTLQDLGNLMIPPVSKAYISQLENGQAMASAATLMDLSRIFGSVQIADEFGHRYVLVYRGHVPTAVSDEIEWPE